MTLVYREQKDPLFIEWPLYIESKKIPYLLNDSCI